MVVGLSERRGPAAAKEPEYERRRTGHYGRRERGLWGGVG